MNAGSLPAAPPATSPTTRAAMRANRSRDTSVELRLRRELHSRGLRYRLHRRPLSGLRCLADIVFPRAKIAVFVDGCWWHGCPQHWAPPKSNRAWWTKKIQINRERDQRNGLALKAAGWTVIRVWEHEAPAAAADRVERLVRLTRESDLLLGQQMGQEAPQIPADLSRSRSRGIGLKSSPT